MLEDKLSDFINEIIDKKQLSSIDSEVRSQLVIDLKSSLNDQINRAIIEALPDDKLNEFNYLLDDANKTDEDIRYFILNSGVNVESVAARTMLQFRDFYLREPRN